jgi:hypothetical protein
MDKKRIILNKTAVAVANPAQKKLLELKDLVDNFSANIDQYKRPDYKEARTRVDFIDKFFELLDWDLSNKQGFAEAYRDVIREDDIRIEGNQKAPDYCFKIGTERKFFVEAKKPSVNIKDDIGAAYQLRRYAYSAKLPLSILTDFHEFAVYDTRIMPKPKDNASVARIFYCQFNEYEQNFDFIYNTFSKSAILKGSFDRYVADNKKKKGTSEVDKEFLKLIEAWRSDLAKNIAINNKKLDLYSLNTSVQKIIDRIIFLRIAEARNIEEYDNLSKIAADGNIYKKLDEYFQRVDKRYNSGLFVVENWLSNLKIDDKILKDIIKSTYFPESPYEFSVLPVEILGNIYEQFLGKVIRLTASHEAKIEEKPEVKKAGGVYYTPQYIVDYIVKNTVGEKIKDSTPDKIEKIKILDPACGSGSFLLGAYDYLLHWHLNYYTSDKKSLEKFKKQSKVYAYKGDFKLTIAEKKKILLNNVFGVDIDSQAVEVTKLSLLLKLMENETHESAGMLIKYSKEALLPDLKNNIKCGNSLIGQDFYEGKNLSLFNADEMRKVNVFDWQNKFSDIFANGGFDIVIGNPPYIDSEGMVNSGQGEIREFISRTYKLTKGNWDIYIAFFEKGLSLLNKKGILSYITPDKWLTKPFGDELRKKAIKNIISILKAGRDVFENAKVDSIVTIFSKKIGDDLEIYNLEDGKITKTNKISKDILKSPYPLDFLFSNDLQLILKLDAVPGKISDLAKCESACATSDAYKLKPLVENLDNNKFDKEKYFKIVNTGTIGKYISKWGMQKMVYLGNKYLLPVVNKKRFLNDFKNTYSQKSVQPKIIIKGLTLLDACIDEEGIFIPGKSTLIIINDDINLLKFISAVINSKIAIFYLKEKYPSSSYNQGINFTKDMVNNLPFSKPSESVRVKIIAFINQMLEIIKQFNNARDADKKIYQQKIEILDKQIDSEVYKLYNLTPEEIKVVEGR